MKSNGFTIVELMVSIGILLILFTLSTINITRLPSSAAQNSSYDQMISDLRSQQTKAMVGYNAKAYGIHFETTSYTIFTGTTYSSSDPENFKVDLDPNITITNDFQNSQVVFTAGSGDWAGTGDTINFLNSTTNTTKVLKINKYGATTQ